MRIINTILILFTLSSFSIAQDSLEQLKHKLKTTENINERYDLELEFAYANKINNIDSSYHVISKLYRQFKKESTPSQLAKSQFYYGSILIVLDSNKVGINHLKEAINYYTKEGNIKQLARIYNNISIGYNNLLNYSKALVYQNKCIALKARAKMPLQSNFVNMGSIYYDLGDYIRAIEYYQLTESYYQSTHNHLNLAKIYTNISVSYNELDSSKAALVYGLKATEISSTLNSPSIKANCNSNLGAVYLKQNKLQNAIYYFDLALFESETHNLYHHQAIAHNNLGHIYTQLDSFQLALFHLNAAYNLSVNHALIEEELINLQSLVEVYHKQENPMIAMKYFNLYVSKTDSLKEIIYTHELPELLQKNNSELSEIMQKNYIKQQQSSKHTLHSIFILFGMESILILLFLGTRFTSLFVNKKFKDIGDIWLAHFTVGCFISFIGYWYYPKESMLQGSFILVGVLLSSMISTLLLLRKVFYQNERIK